MTQLEWDKVGERTYETGVDHGVLYIPNGAGVYNAGYAWNGLTAVNEAPSGAEASPQYADNIKYINLISTEEFNATVEAFTYPDEFGQCDGTAEPAPGMTIGQQNRKPFGLAYRTLKGNDLEGTDYGYKIHLVYGASAAPSEKAYGTVNESPEAITFSWELSTTPVAVGTLGGTAYKPTASITIDSTTTPAANLAALEQILYGAVGVDPRLPLPAEVYTLVNVALILATPTEPAYNSSTDTITIPSITGVVYKINGEVVTGAVVITQDTVVTAEPATGYKFPAVTDDDWFYDHT